MRESTVLVSERKLMYCIAGQMYDQAPDRRPRKVDVIMDAVKSKFRSDEKCFNDNEHYTIRIPSNKLYEYLDKLLKSIPEFEELNLSHIEHEKGIKVDDPNRPKYNFVTRYDKYDKDSWKSDFIDLDAFIGNVCNSLLHWIDADFDCFMCKHQDTKSNNSTISPGCNSRCHNCSINSDNTNNYESNRFPRGKYTFACKFDCYRSRYICCEECDDKDGCKYKCDSSSDKCGLTMNHIQKNKE